ncbi:hypothetical protein LOC69_19535 [Blastopirellula sp. JC733]|nr:hypothetical protein [Blastopirellula sediminis]
MFLLPPLVSLLINGGVLQAQNLVQAVPVEGAPLDAENRQQAAAVRLALLPTASHELSFLKRAVDLSEEQMVSAQKCARQILSESSANPPTPLANADELRQIGFAIANGAKVQALQPRPAVRNVEKLRASLLVSLQGEFGKLLDGPQRQRYEEEIAARKEFEQQTVIDLLMFPLEEKLRLTSRQSEQIAAGMKRHWSDSWAPTPVKLVNYGSYFPPIPDDAIVPFLEVGQRQIWNNTQKVNFSHQIGFDANLFQNEFDLSDPEFEKGAAQ